MPIVPTGYGNKNTPVDNDSLFGYDSEGVLNSNFLFSAIRTYVFNGITTTSVDEGVNLYYTDARVAANSTVQGKSDKTDVLEKTNTTTYTPTTDYHPATKKYVDDINVIQKASVAEAVAGLDDTKYITPLSGLSAYGNVVPGTDYAYLESNSEKQSPENAETLLKQFTINKEGGYTYSIDVKKDNTSSGSSFVSIRKNGVSFYSQNVTSLTYITITGEMDFNREDTLDIFVDTGFGISMTVRNFNLKYSLVAGVTPGVIELN